MKDGITLIFRDRKTNEVFESIVIKGDVARVQDIRKALQQKKVVMPNITIDMMLPDGELHKTG